MSRLDEIQKRYANTPAFGQGSTLTPAQMTYKATDPAVVEEQKKQSQSKGLARFGEGVGYFFEKVGLGALRGIEGIVDFTAGGIADLFGADAWAERQVANDWVNYDHAEEWYQPRNGFERFMGDLGGGIGSTLPALAAVALGAAITYVTGGAGAGAGAAVAGAGTAGLSTAMSMLISGATTLYSSGGIALAEAYKESGELTGKEWGYAALSGGTEGAIEAISAGIGVGTGKLIKQFSKSGSKVVASGLKKTALNLGKDFISEGAEEAAMEYIQPKFKQLTYDPNAKDATAQQIIYSGIVGGVSGMLMDGANVVVSKATDSVTGTLISKDQAKVDSVLAAAKSYADMESKKPTKSEIIPEIAKQLEKYNSLGDGAINNAKKTAILGSLSRLELLAETDKMAVGETMSILSNAESFAKTFKDGKYITPEGKEITVTKEALTNGIDLKDGKPTLDSIRKAIKNNFTLRAIVAARVSGEILANAGAMYTEVMEGNKTFQSDDEYREFVEGLTDEQAESVMKQTGIDTMADNAATANAKLYYWKSEGNGKFIPKFNKAKKAEIRSKTLPQNPASVKVKKGELARYNDGFFDIVIEHNEDGTYNIFDINGGSGKLNVTRKELNGYINSYRQAMVEVASAPTEMVEEVKKAREVKQTEESAERARLRKEATETVSRISERVEAYNGLSEPNKRAVREMARKAVSLGIKEDVILSSATYMANTGLNIQFVRPEVFDRPNVNALLKGDTIYINTGEVEISKAKTFDQLIIHETSHVLYRNSKVRKAIDKLAKRLTEEQRQQIEADYAEIVESKSKTEKQQIMDDEFGAHYLEYLLGTDGMLDALFSEELTVRDKLEAHINKTEIAYKADHNLDRASKRVFKLFKKALADFSESNRGYNAYNVAPTDTLGIDDGRYNLAATDMHKKKLAEAYNGKEATVSLGELNKRYDKIITAWKEIGLELNSSFLEEWNSKKGKDAAYTLFKEQSGYKYNIELSTMCKKGLSLFEAIDTIVRKELTKQLDSTVITKADKEILYDILKTKGYDIPCAICYVEQARQREGVIIDAFVNGNKDGKLGWNSTIADIEQRMAAKGVSYKFPAADRAIATDEYSPGKSVKLMTEAEQKAYYDALLEITNEEVARYNKKAKKSRDMLKNTNAATVRSYFKGSLPSNLKLLKILFLNPESRFTIESDLLYSSHTARNLATFNTELYSLFNAQSGVAGYKLKQSPIIYWAEILDKQWAPSTLRKSGAIRNQSNSDLQMYTLLDQVQMYIDLTAKGYYLHAYTKVVSELKLLGLSNAKINASLIPQVKVYYKADGTVNIEKTKLNAGLDADGNLLFDDFEGINHNEAFMLLADKDYSKSLCGICIGYSDKHILKLLDEPRVQLIIGYHDKTNDMEKRYKGARYAKNYNGQNEAYDNANRETKHINFTTYLAKAEGMFKKDKATESFSGTTEYNGKRYTADDIPRLAARLYLDYCKSNDIAPAYSGRGEGNVDFTTHENYYKLLGDFGLYDSEGHYAPLKKVAYNMPDTVPILQPDGSVTRMDTKEYIKKELRGELEVRDRLAQDLADTSKDGILQQFVSAKNAQSIQPKISTEDGRASVTSNRTPYAEYDKPITAQDVATLRTIPRKSINEFTSEEIQKTQKWAHKFYKELGVKSPFFRAWFGDWRSEDKYTKRKTTAISSVKASSKDENVLYVKLGLKDHSLFRGDVKNTDTDFDINIGSHVYNDTLTYATRELSRRNDIQKFNDKIALLTEIREIVEKSIMLDSAVINDNDNADRTFMHYFYSIAKVQNRAYLVKLGVDELNAIRGTIRRAYNVDNIKISPIAVSQVYKPADTIGDGGDYLSTYSISDLFAFVKRYDPEFKPNPVNPLLLNSDGTPKVFYHGTNKVFDEFKVGTSGGIYLADNRKVSEAFTKTGNVMEVYPSMRNPLVVDALVESEFLGIKSYKQSFYYEIPTPQIMKDNGYKSDTLSTEEISAFARENNYDGVIITNVREVDGPATTDAIVFLPEQIKSANDNIGTFDRGTSKFRYSVTTPGGGAMGAPSFVDPARRSATLQSSGYKPTFGESFKDGAVATKIAATNAQAGLERLMREVGYTREEAETDVQFARLARAQASNVIGVKFTDISGNADGYEVLGDSLVETLAPVMPSKFTKDGSTAEEQRYTDFQMLQYHMLNVDRMSLEAKAKKRYLPLDAIRQRLALESEGIKTKMDAISGIRAKIEENKTQLAREKKKPSPDKDRIIELTDRIAELEKNADKIVKGAVKRYTAKNVDAMFTMDEAMLKGIAKEAKLTEEEIKSLIGNAVAVLTAEDIEALNGLSSITDPIAMLKVVRKIIDRHAHNLGTQIKDLMQIKNKPVLGKTVVQKNIDPETKAETKVETVEPMTAEESRKLIKKYEEKYKGDEGFNKALKGVRTYLDNLMRLRIDTGLVSADMAASLADMYPNYVPAHRLDPASGLMVLKGSRLVEVNKTVSTAKGSIKQIKPLHENLIEQTESTVRAARLNQLMSKLYERFEASDNPNKEKHFKVVEKKPLTKGDPVTADELYNVDYTSPEKAPRENQITFFYNGEKITVEVSKDVFVGFNDLAGRRGEGLLGGGNFFGARVLEGGMKVFRAVTTNYNPFFIIRNLLKDLGDALLLSDVPFYSFGANYVGAIKQMAKNSEAWRLYVANGGLGNTFFDSKLKLDLKTSQRGYHIDSATKNPLSWFKTLGSAVEVGNQFVEQIPRFAAFLAARKGGATVAEAMNAAAEITTNFQRGGTVTKTFNRSLIPFLNASVQGFVKMPRRLFNLHGKTWRETLEKLAVLLTNCVIVGIVPLVINALICGDQEGYDELRNTDKENYFLIPTGDGKFIKIPRGRVQASLASISNLVTGGSTVKETWGNVSSQVSPWGTMTRTIFSPIKDVSTNTTWYGGEIEGQQFEGIRPGARYDEGTSWMAKMIGGVLDYSPKKIDYLLGQYTGFFGDVILDATNQKANGNPLVTNFSVDSVTSNKLSTEFYRYYNEAQYAKSEGDETALYQLKYLNKVKKEIRELYDQKSAIQTNSELSSKEKLEQTRVIQSYINGLYSAAIDNFSKVTDSAVATSGFGLEENERFREVIRQSFGAEAALEHWDEKLYESAKQMQTAGVSFEDYYDFYFSTSKIESDKDKNGNTVSGSKRAKVLEIVKAMDIPTEQKMLLFTSRGYSIKSRDFSNYSENTARNRLLKYILSLNVSKDEKARIAEMCGFKVKNGKIIRE